MLKSLAHTQTRSLADDCSVSSDTIDEPRWAGWVLALLIYAIYAVIASPAIASIVG
jgi:hypothetical protein